MFANLYGGSGASLTPVIVYLSIVAAVSLVTVIFMPESKDRSLGDEPRRESGHGTTAAAALSATGGFGGDSAGKTGVEVG